jgi:hypothetical protein
MKFLLIEEDQKVDYPAQKGNGIAVGIGST